jgi:glutamyl-tRNA synthetase
LRYLARSAPAELNFYGVDSLGATHIDYWVDYSVKNVAAGANFEAVCHGINDYLALRTYLVGYSLTVADIALWGQLQGTHQS